MFDSVYKWTPFYPNEIKYYQADLHCRHLTMVEHWITGKWLRSLKGWIRTPKGNRAFFSSPSVSGTWKDKKWQVTFTHIYASKVFNMGKAFYACNTFYMSNAFNMLNMFFSWSPLQAPSTLIQSGLEFRTFEYRIHSKTERFKVPFSIRNIATSLGCFIQKIFFLYIYNGQG